MKYSLATKITVLAQAVFVAAAIPVILLVHHHLSTALETTARRHAEQQLQFVISELNLREIQFRGRSQLPLEAFQNDILRDLGHIYLGESRPETFLFLLDADGSVLLHPHLEYGNRSLQSLFGNLGDARQGTVSMEQNGIALRASYTTFAPWQWTVFWVSPTLLPERIMRGMRTGSVFLLVSSLFMLSLVLAYFINRMIRPVDELALVADSIAKGDPVQPAQTRRRDEVGDLARAFSRMQEVIRDKIEQLDLSEKHYKQLVQHANSIILRWDRDGLVTFLNDHGLQLFGFRPDEIIGHHVVGTIVAETETLTGRDLVAMINDILARPETFVHNENENICKDGSLLWIQWSNTPIVDGQGRFVEMLSIGINVTERKKAEQLLRENEFRYRALFDSASDAILIRDDQGLCIACNQKALELFGCTREQLVGQTPAFITPEWQPSGEKSASRADELIRKALEGKPQSVEWQIKRFDGELRDVRASVSSFEANGHRYVQSVLTDITRQKRMEVELRQAQKMEGIGTLAGGIAHDFNNILSAIIGYTELAQMKVEADSELARDLGQVRKASERARGLVRQILTFSRKQKQEDSVIQISLIVKEALKLIRSSIPTTIEIDQKITSRAGVRTDPTLIHQLIMNLCTNAYQAIPDTGGRLTVTMRDVMLGARAGRKPVDLPDGPYVNLKISDSGCGIAPELMDRIFDPFFTTKEQGRGTGLGLAVVHDIVQGLGGGITVASEPGKGTTFSIYLPAENGGEVARDTPADPDRAAPRNERIMVVDDEPAICELMEAILSGAGYQVDLFANGEEAWLAFAKSPDKWSLLITDQTMPRMIGSQLAVQAMELRPDLPVILCTGYSESLSVERALELGIKTYLHKPISLNELLVAVHDALEQ